MKSIFILSTLLTFACTTALATPALIDLPTGTVGWRMSQHNPGGQYGGIDGANDGYSWDMNYGSGWDDDGLPVYAVESGCIYTGGGWGGSSYGQVLINHTTGNDTWSSGYLHLKNIAKKAGCVVKGEKIGEVSRTGYLINSAITTPHLHFAVYNSHGKSGLQSVNAGFTGVSASAAASSQSATLSYFDGAGSLVRPTEDCWGCNKDEAIMHPRAGRPSTVVFQWLHDAAVCEHVDVTTTPNVGAVAVRARAWNAHEMSAAFVSTTPVSITSQGQWTIFSITSDKPLISKVSVKAFCKPIGNTVGNIINFAKDLVGFDSDYFWSGNGSLISISPYPYFGTKKDIAVTYSAHRSLTVFQWYRGSSCMKVNIKDGAGAIAAGFVSKKLWNEQDFGPSTCTQLPCTVDAPSDGYYLIKVKSDDNAMPSGQLSAVCTN